MSPSPEVGHFGWEPCGLTVVKQDGTKVLQCQADSGNQYNLNVQLSRDLAWDNNKRSWRWHKTWRVPDCLVTADVNALHGVSDLEAHLSVVCQAELPHHLEDAGVQSLDRSNRTASLQLVDGRCRFSRLRLVATTSTFGGRLFHFVVSIVKRNPETGEITALASVISTAFAVYSRKNADKKRKAIDRDAMISGRWSEGYSFVPFEPKELERTFIKKTTNTKGLLVEEEITNSWEGLLAYFQAPNIRFKIRHPLFLAIRFSNVLVILRDALRFPQESEEALRSFICSCGFPLNCQRDPAVKIGHGEFLPPWLIAFRSAAMKHCNQSTIHKLADLMKVVKGPALGFVPDDSLLPQRYSPTFDVTSLGQLYTKLYAIEFAAAMGDEDIREQDNNSTTNTAETGAQQQQNGKGVQNGSKLNKLRTAKRAKTKIEPVQADGLVGFHPCGTPIFHTENDDASNLFRNGPNMELPNAGEVEMEDSSSGSSPHGARSQFMRTSFESYFIALHGELRMLLEKVVELVSHCVTRQDTADVENLRKAYADFTEALSVHAYVEENVLFKKLSDRVPNVTESYTVDHAMEKGRMDEISNIMKKMDARKITELFLKISELAAVHKIHMDKEEVHLLPYFLKNFDDSEISELIRQCQSTINAKLIEQQNQESGESPNRNGNDNGSGGTGGAPAIGDGGGGGGGGGQLPIAGNTTGGGGTHEIYMTNNGGGAAGTSMTMRVNGAQSVSTTTSSSADKPAMEEIMEDTQSGKGTMATINREALQQGLISGQTPSARYDVHIENGNSNNVIGNATMGSAQAMFGHQQQCATLNGKSDGFVDDGDKISLLNPRHQNAIERAIRAANGTDNDSENSGDGDIDVYVDPPDIIDDQLFFDGHSKNVSNAHQGVGGTNGRFVQSHDAVGLNGSNTPGSTATAAAGTSGEDIDLNVMRDDDCHVVPDYTNHQHEQQVPSQLPVLPPQQSHQQEINSALFKKGTFTSPNVSFTRNASGDDDVIALLEEIYN